MALETEIGRLIVSIELLINAINKQNGITTTGTPTKTKVIKKEPDPAPAAEADVDPFAETPAESVEPAVTLDKLSETLKKHAAALGTKSTIALIKKYGADAATPKIATIPTANYADCLKEALADLKKVKV